MNDARVEELKSLLPQCLLWDWVRLGSRLVRLLRDHHHASAHDAVMDRLLAQARESVEMRSLRAAHVPLATYPPDLPITARKDDIVAAIRANQVVVIAGETGSGKTTQIPKMCLEAGLGIEAKIGCTQPRRVAAVSISQRIAEELQVGWGREVGCKIRFDDRSGDETYIKLMTDGILLAEVQGDPLLTEYNAIILDEAHERSLNIDFLLGYLKGLLKERPDLKLLITSATIDTQTFSRAFDNAPIIEVSGRMFPVEVLYRPIDAASEERGEITFVDAAVEETERVLYESSVGDVLIFMPGERDIRETSDQLEGRLGRDAEIIPLYGRLSTGDQQRVFSPSSRRKVIVATNIAETSLTIPGIRYVIDAGFARMSRYNPRTRTRRLPVEPVSQSSANQRKGRAGRVQDGVCIRLYSEEDFGSRPPFTQPEIQRANLAEVILRMKAFRLGEIETFPFVNPPSPASITGGYALLQELGALDEHRQLTQMGRDLARLPIDPTLGRMLLQSQVEHATRELLIIASGLSVQDPRERPLDQREAADAAHRRYSDPRSDFLSLLKLWDAVHDEWEKQRTQNLRRRFCRTNFLSYLRMREWQDLHAQLHDALDGVEAVHLNESNAEYEAVHRSILSGLLGHSAHREERNGYKAGGNRLLTLFPGSALYDRGDKNANLRRGRGKGPADSAHDQPAKEAAPKQPEWIVAGEIVETSQLFARTVAGIDPEWIVQIAPHLCKVTHHHPHWSAAAGRVLVEEKVTFQGLEVRSRRVAYASINPKDATAIFIRSALVEESMDPPGEEEDERGNDETRVRRQLRAAQLTRERRPARYPFLDHNRTIRERIETWQTRVRRNVLGDVEEALFEFYSKHIENVSSLDELDRLLRDRPEAGFLCVREEDLSGGMDMAYDATAFPDAVPLGGQATELRYAYAPGEDHDGVTIRLNVEVARSLAPGEVEWSVPGLRSELVMELLRALPKSLRRDLMPLPHKVEEIVRELKPTGPSLLHDLAAFIRRRYAIDVQPGSWAESSIPAHLRPRVEVLTNDGKVVGSGRDLGAIREQFPKSSAKPTADSGAWARAARQWERFGLTGWSFGDLPVSVQVEEVGGLPVMGWLGLAVEENGVSVRLFRGQIVARRSSLEGIRRLIEQALQKDFAWVQRDLRSLAKHALLYVPLGDLDELVDSTYRHLRGLVLPGKAFSPLTAAAFNAAVEETRNQLRGVVPPLVDRIGMILELRRQVAQRIGSPPATLGSAAAKPKVLTDLSQLGLKPKVPAGPVAVAAPMPVGLHSELASILPPRFPEKYNATAMGHLPRYLKALLTRAERASQNPAKEQERVKLLAPYAEALRQFAAKPPPTDEGRYWLNEFRWMVEEYKVSLFAQELGTAQPVSPKRLDEMLLRVKNSDPIP
jgi:ATP-dependent helicase HrpA